MTQTNTNDTPMTKPSSTVKLSLPQKEWAIFASILKNAGRLIHGTDVSFVERDPRFHTFIADRLDGYGDLIFQFLDNMDIEED